MRTSKPISCISYNTFDFLKSTLDDLVERCVIEFYFFMYHYKEEDDLKNHYHVYLEPNRLIDTMDLRTLFKEVDDNPLKPLGTTKFVRSDPDNAIPYFLHDAGYLALKHESRIYHYEKNDFITNDLDTFHEYYVHAMKASQWSSTVELYERLSDDTMSPIDLINKGYVPFNMSSQLNSYINMKNNYGTVRNKEHYDLDNYKCIDFDAETKRLQELRKVKNG